MSLRTKVIQLLIDVNEKIIFYPQLRKFYLSHFNNKPLTVIDVGTNKGQSIDFFKKISPQAKIFGFEPNKKLYNGLKEKYKSHDSVKLHNLGVSSKAGMLTFHENILDETSTFEELNFESKYLEKKARVLGVSKNEIIVDSYEVEVTTLSDFLSKQNETFYHVLKIDIEGHELEGLKGLFGSTKKQLPIRFIQMESHNDDMYLSNSKANEIVDLLEENNFYEVAKFKHGFGDFYEIIYENKEYRKPN